MEAMIGLVSLVSDGRLPLPVLLSFWPTRFLASSGRGTWVVRQYDVNFRMLFAFHQRQKMWRFEAVGQVSVVRESLSP